MLGVVICYGVVQHGDDGYQNELLNLEVISYRQLDGELLAYANVIVTIT